MIDQTTLVLKAASTAALWHASQQRKGRTPEPYINHLLEVAYLVSEATEGRDINLVAAALLHDAIEDQHILASTIAQLFNEDVARLVEEVTDDKTLPETERRRRQVQEAPSKSARARLLKLADKISNVASMTSNPPDWPEERRLGYVHWAREVVERLKPTSYELLKRFYDVAREAELMVKQHHQRE